jgi:hypothetical protein
MVIPTRRAGVGLPAEAVVMTKPSRTQARVVVEGNFTPVGSWFVRRVRAAVRSQTQPALVALTACRPETVLPSMSVTSSA